MFSINSKLQMFLQCSVTKCSILLHVKPYSRKTGWILKCYSDKYPYFNILKYFSSCMFYKKPKLCHLTSQLKYLSGFSLRFNLYTNNRCIHNKSILNYPNLHLSQAHVMHLTNRGLQTTSHHSQARQDRISALLYACSLLIFMIGVSYASVPLYRIFCQATGIGGDPTIGHKIASVGTMKPIRERKIHVSFNADHHSSMQWNFKPSQREITVVPGETALAFYSAKNPTDKPIVGIATYNVVPFQAGLYFNKIQCFCFEEQWLNPNEEVDMPVFFYIDPDYDDDPLLAKTDDIILSYTFFKAHEGQTLPLPGFMKANSVVNLNQAAKNEATQ